MNFNRTAILMALAAGTTLGQGTPEIRVLIFDRGSQTDITLTRALAEASRLFGDAGVAIRWIACPNTSVEMSKFPDCRFDDAALIMLRIIGAPKPGLVRDAALGFTVPAEEGAAYATVFSDRVRETASASRHPEATILGDAIAHELGHVLLGSVAHAKQGLMSARWTPTELERADLGLLRFTAQECATLRTAATRRSESMSVVRPARER